MSRGFAHAKRDERCTRCNDLAARIVGSKAVCVDHFGLLVGAIAQRVRWRMLTPPESADSADEWLVLLDHGVFIGALTDDDARHAWDDFRIDVAA